MYLRMVRASLIRDPRRKVVAFAAVALGVLAATALTAVLVSSGDRLAAEMGAYGANLEVLPAEGREVFEASELGKIRKVFWRHNILAFAPELPLRAKLAARDGNDGREPRSRVAPLVGTWFDVAVEEDWRTGLPATRPTLEIEGRWPRDGASEVVLGRRLARRLEAAPGATVEATIGSRQRRLEVVGRVTSGGPEEEQAFAPLAVVSELAGHAAGVATRAEVFALTVPETHPIEDPEALDAEAYERWYCTAYPSVIALQIDEALADARAQTLTGITDATAELLLSLRRVLLALAVVILVGAGLGVAAVTTTSMLERRQEAGLLLALGAETWKVAAFFVAEALIIGLTGGLAGGLLGLIAGRALGTAVLGVAVPWVPVLLPAAVAAGCAVAVAGALAPVLRLLADRPALALKEAAA